MSNKHPCWIVASVNNISDLCKWLFFLDIWRTVLALTIWITACMFYNRNLCSKLLSKKIGLFRQKLNSILVQWCYPLECITFQNLSTTCMKTSFVMFYWRNSHHWITRLFVDTLISIMLSQVSSLLPQNNSPIATQWAQIASHVNQCLNLTFWYDIHIIT